MSMTPEQIEQELCRAYGGGPEMRIYPPLLRTVNRLILEARLESSKAVATWYGQNKFWPHEVVAYIKQLESELEKVKRGEAKS